ncbi:MAG TPA: DUF4962 domain-containing protein, partial [Armatimonadota bacterium]|nr:DUF4962 domain-containing protein [Armatimonadota bacterium]
MILSLALLPMLAAAEDVFLYDFEQGEDLAAYQGLDASKVDAAIVSPGAGGEGHCLRISSRQTDKYCNMTIARPMTVVKNLVLSFDYRATIGEGQKALYVGLIFFYEDGKQFGRWDHKFSDDWAHAEVTLQSLSSGNEGVLEIGRQFVRLNLYGRASDEGGDMTVWFDNIRLGVREQSSRLLEQVETSYNNPPLLNWPQAISASRLQYSRSPDFPDAGTVTLDTPWNFHTPPEPIEPGRWYWRAYAQTQFTEGWTDIHQLDIPEEAHRFTTPPIDAGAIIASPRPWLIDVAAERATRDEAAIASLIKSAESEHARGVPDDPPIWQEGDERWPAWIDWYRDVHGRITSATGGRLERMASYAAISGDDRVYDWTREMALAVATWDPKGGSAMSRGDIGAHHVLRGLNACYDVLRDRLSDEERAALMNAIIARAGYFWGYINPLRGNPYNNHAWLKTLALGQSGLALLGDHDQAEQWAEFSRQQFIGQYLCGLGWQGENNEGISYWSYGLSFILEYADMLQTVTGLDLYQQPWLNQTARFPMYCAPPNAWAVSFADTAKPNHSIRGPYSTNYVGMLATRARDPYALWYSGSREAVEGLEPRPPVDLPQSILYRFIGLAVLNTSLVDGREGVTFAMHSGPYYAGHQHADQNAFVIHAYGEKLAIDSGYYDWYGSPHFKAYSIQTQAHNCILVNGKGQAFATNGADGHTTAYFDSPGWSWVAGDASDPDVYGGALTRFDRRVLLVRPGVIVIHDLLDAPEPSSFEWLLHTVAPIETDRSARSFSATSGAATMRATMLEPQRVTMTVTDRYPVHPYDGYGTVPVPEEKLAQEWHLTITPPEPAVRQDFLTVFDVRRSEDQGQAAVRTMPAEQGLGLTISEGPRRTAVLLAGRDGPGPLAAGDFRADAGAAAVTVEGERILGAFAAASRSVTRGGRTLFAADAGVADFGLLVGPDASLAHLALDQDARVTLASPTRPARALLDGRPVDVSWNARDRTVSLSLPAGEYVLAYGDRPGEAVSHPLPPVKMAASNGGGSLEGYSRRVAGGSLRNWWGEVALPAASFYDLRLTGVSGEPPTVAWDGSAVKLAAAGDECRGELWAAAGAHHVTIGSSGALGAIELTPTGPAAVPALMLPADWQLPEGALAVEAENLAAEGDVRASITEKVAASGGLAHVGWDTDGQWAEWTLPVPAEGDYSLLLRAASVYDGIVRDIRLDGERIAIATFGSTGGWCRTANDWRWFRLQAAEGEPLLVSLAPGQHTLRITRL